MSSMEIYYRNLVSIMNCRLLELVGISSDIKSQINDVGLDNYNNPEWRRRAGFKLRKVNSEIARLNHSIRIQKNKIKIANCYTSDTIVISKKSAIAYAEREILMGALKAKLKDAIGTDEYARYMREVFSPINTKVRGDLIDHFKSKDKFPGPLEIYDWRQR